MTTVTFIKKKCAVCGTESRQAEAGIRIEGRPVDLDMRPGGVLRTAVYISIQRCEKCGYCAPDIGTAAPGIKKIKEIISREDYKRQYNEKEFSDTLNAFLCWSIIQESQGNYADSGWARLHAAWICDDDAKFRKKASAMRKEALEFFEKAISKKQRFASNEEEEILILIDLYRRSGQLKKALKLCEEEMAKKYDDWVRSIIIYQSDLAEEGDTKSHPLSDARGEED